MILRRQRSRPRIDAAAALLAAGELVAFPTETVYGLGADAGSDAAVAKIFAAKGRPSDHPLIVHVADAAAASRISPREVPPLRAAADAAFWPGPLTLILPRARRRRGRGRRPGHRRPALPGASGGACAARGLRARQPAVAGIAGAEREPVRPRQPDHRRARRHEFGDELLVLDGGACEVGIESTIVDCTRGVPVLLRPALLTRAQHRGGVRRAAARRATAGPRRAPPARCESHYAPNAQAAPDGRRRRCRRALDVLGAEARRRHRRVVAHVPATAPQGVLRRRMPD